MEAYAVQDLTNKAHLLKGKLLLMVNLEDAPTAADVFKMAHKLVEAGIQFDMMVYPEGIHSSPQYIREHSNEKIKDYLVEHLK